jgi:tRNA (cytidine32/uridine32-2'-O)-methyltransferase
MTDSPRLYDSPRVVLVGTQHPGNIGSAARAMKTMGLGRLLLVAPERLPDRDSFALAAGANDVLDRAEIHATLADALADCRLVIASTARQRTVPMPELTPREGAAGRVEGPARGPGGRVVGRERTGQVNEEIELWHPAVCIPANPDYSSLNLAAAVQVMAYEWRMAMLATAPPAPAPAVAADPDDLPAPHAQLESFFAHLGGFLDEIDFHKGKAPDMVTQRLRRLFLRASPDPRELRILRGILSDTQRLLHAARKP